jgi:hypothetical protein
MAECSLPVGVLPAALVEPSGQGDPVSSIEGDWS